MTIPSKYDVIIEQLTAILKHEAEASERIAVIEDRTERMMKLIEGNGKPGLVSDVQCLDKRILLLEATVASHQADETAQASDQKAEKKVKSDRTWALILLAIGQVVILIKDLFMKG